MLALAGCNKKTGSSLLQGPYDLGEIGERDRIAFFDSVRYEYRHVLLEQSHVEHYMDAPLDFLVDDSLIYLSDGKTIKVFDRQGHFIKTLGDRGEGPGEYQFATQIFKCHDMIGVYDAMLKKFIFYRNLEYAYNFSFYAAGTLFDDPICHDQYLYISIRGFTPEWPYHLLKIDTTGNVVKAAMRMIDKYHAYFYTGLFYIHLLELEEKIALAHALYKKVVYFDYDLDSLYAEPLIMPPRCETWRWPEIHEINADDAAAYEEQFFRIRDLVNKQAPCIFVSMYPYKEYKIYNYLVGRDVDVKVVVSIVYDQKRDKKTYLIGGERFHVRGDRFVECAMDERDRLYCDFFRIDLQRESASLTLTHP